MKILIINPNTSVEMTKGIDEVAKKYAKTDTLIETVCPKEGPRSIESYYEEDLVAQGVLEGVIEANEKNYDAIIIACYGDPHLQSSKEISDIPVYGIAEVSMHMACLFGHRFSIVTVLERARPIFEELVRRVGLESKCASIRTTKLRVLDIEKDPSITLEILTEAGRAAIIEDGAEVICLGCAGMAGLDKPMEEELGVPVLDGVVCAVKVAEAAFDYKIKLSKIKAYKRPEPKEFVGLQKFIISR
ncbi:MAG: aspartate/glutamate racemase family protein [Deltaproteobacteria bacterium]|nr:aspartate/glutamate racemase family protein [Deltaproteobacteria bacterium]MBW2045382.1 aspartate/glutamate racemase family protein [Deltaproteobacteria bacterium]MBW2301775.1 aspartate/glutamate racemase family protein [Deltaproteobacteria bacterium]